MTGGWTTPTTWNPGQVVSATDLNTHLRDNLNYLVSGFPMSMVVRNNAGNYTTTSTTFVDVDATNLIITITLQSGRAIIYAQCMCLGDAAAGDGMEIDIIVDSTTRAGNATHGLFRVARTLRSHAAVFAVFTGLSVNASHTFKLQFRTVGAGTATIEANPGNTTTTSGSLVQMVGWGF
jgi:hypothetical protein